MRLTIRPIVVVAGLMLVSSVAVAQSAVGTITRTRGVVEIDAFGVGAYVDVAVPDRVYDTSVVRTDYESWAEITIGDAQFTIGPSSETPVASFLNDRRRREPGFFGRIMRGLTRSLAPPEDEVLVAGGRAAEVQGPTTAWVFDTDPDELYAQALEDISDGDFGAAVESLRQIDYPSDGQFDIEDYYVNLSYALMGLGDFHAAMAAGFEYAGSQPDTDDVALLPPRLHLLSGVAGYYAGADDIARACLDAYLDETPMDQAAPEAVGARYHLLLGRGQSADADALLSRAERAQPGVDWAAVVNP